MLLKKKMLLKVAQIVYEKIPLTATALKEKHVWTEITPFRRVFAHRHIEIYFTNFHVYSGYLYIIFIYCNKVFTYLHIVTKERPPIIFILIRAFAMTIKQGRIEMFAVHFGG